MPNLLLNAQKEVYPLMPNKTLKLAAWKISGNPLLIQDYQRRLTVLFPSARKPISNSNYDSSWGKQVRWCFRKKNDPVQCSVNFILDFHAGLCDLRHKYKLINSCRSGISAYHYQVERKPVGQHKHVCALLRGVFAKKQPHSRYALLK